MYRTLLTFLFILSTTLANPIDAPVAPRSIVNDPCTGAGAAPGVCISTSSCSSAGGIYVSGACPGTPADIKCCTKTPCGVGGNCRFTSQCPTGNIASNMCPGPSSFKCCLPRPGTSITNGPITRSEIISRGKYWINKHVPYNQTKFYPDPDGANYRTDCSGFVAMALRATAPGTSTVGMINIAKEIKWDELQPGDFVGVLGDGTGEDKGHVTLFWAWVDKNTKKKYKSLECKGTDYGCLASEREVKWKKGAKVAKPYRYIRVK